MIILGVMAIVILYAAFDFLTPSKKDSRGWISVQKTAELNTFVTDLTAGLGKDSVQKSGRPDLQPGGEGMDTGPFSGRQGL